MRTVVNSFIALCFLSWVTNARGWDSYVRDACSVTRYQDLCIHSLASFAHSARNSPSKWARAGVSVTIEEAKNVTQYLHKLKNWKIIRSGKNRIALSDCIECFQDAIDNLHKSLAELRKLDATNFETQMADLTTWMSAVLTDEDTCLDGFEQSSENLQTLRNRVSRATCITSNALALVNKLAATGLASLKN